MGSKPLLQWTNSGLYCAQGDFYIDPIRPVHRALITHAHSDHARHGMGQYIAHEDSVPILKLRLGRNISTVALAYGERRSIHGVNISLHPAGHIIGSAQIRLSYKGEIWVASGDYHTTNTTCCVPFEPVRCHTFITESTFGLPCFQWDETSVLIQHIADWILHNREQDRASVLLCYALGKAQRILCELPPELGVIHVHSSIQNINDSLRTRHVNLPLTERIKGSMDKGRWSKKIILAPPSVLRTQWLAKMPIYHTAWLSGWATNPKSNHNLSVDQKFAFSDHADCNGLIQATKATGAENVIVNHGFTAEFSAHLRQLGLNAQPLNTQIAPL